MLVLGLLWVEPETGLVILTIGGPDKGLVVTLTVTVAFPVAP